MLIMDVWSVAGNKGKFDIDSEDYQNSSKKNHDLYKLISFWVSFILPKFTCPFRNLSSSDLNCSGLSSLKETTLTPPADILSTLDYARSALSSVFSGLNP